MTTRCTKSIVLMSPADYESTKVPLSKLHLYALVDGRLERIRHRSQLPAFNGFAGPMVISSPTTLTPEQKQAAASLLAADLAPQALENAIPGAEFFYAPQARKTASTPAGFLDADRLGALLGEGGQGSRRGPRAELYALLANDRISGSFYESPETRGARRAKLINELTKSSPDWLVELTTTLRRSANTRSAAVCLAVDAIMAGHSQGRDLLAGALLRPDEPALALRYFFDTYPGAKMPRQLRAGLADSAQRLFDESAVLSYNRTRTRTIDGRPLDDGQTPVTMRDVIRLTHPRPKDEAQSALFAYLTRGTLNSEHLPRLTVRAELNALDDAQREAVLAAGAQEAREVLANGYSARSRLRSPLGALSATELFAWQPSAIRIAQQRAQAAALRERIADARGDMLEAAAASSAKASTLRYRLARLQARQQDDANRLRFARLEHLTERERERFGAPSQVEARMAKREAKIKDLEDHPVLATREAYSQLVDELKGLPTRQARSSHPRSEVLEVAMLSMGYKETIGALTKISTLDAPARQYAIDHLSDKTSLARSSLQITDLVTAAQALRGKELTDDQLEFVATALDASGRIITRDSLGDLKDKRILVLVDGSGSMREPVSLRRGDVRAESYEGTTRAELASGFAGMIASSGSAVDVVVYSMTGNRVEIPDDLGPVTSSMFIASKIPGGGTDTFGVLADHYADHDVVVVLTDEQTSWSPFAPRTDGYAAGYGRRLSDLQRDFMLPAHAKMITCNLAGDETAHGASHPNHLTVAGASPVVLDGLRAAIDGLAWDAGV